MIPYFEFSTINFGPVTIQVWGTFVALGIIIGTLVSKKFAKRDKLNPELISTVAFWIILSAFLGARVVHILFYDFSFFASNPSEIIKVWHGGFSVVGGFIGAAIAYLLYMKRHHISPYKYADAFIFGLPIGLAIGRIGCFLIHDHPGTATDFFLAVQNQNGVGAFHDHGLYLSINAFLMAIVFFILSKKPRKEGFYIRLFLIWYGIVRFILDFWREVDATYLGVTPAQYIAFFMALGGVIWLMTSREGAPEISLH